LLVQFECGDHIPSSWMERSVELFVIGFWIFCDHNMSYVSDHGSEQVQIQG